MVNARAGKLEASLHRIRDDCMSEQWLKARAYAESIDPFWFILSSCDTTATRTGAASRAHARLRRDVLHDLLEFI